MVRTQEGGSQLPAIQIADHLVNGAGFCVRLGECSPETGQPRVLNVIRKIIDPMSETRKNLEFDDHASRCKHACYKCLLRYGNQPFHGLLDWRLGLSYLALLIDPEFAAGLDGNMDVPGLKGWTEYVDASLATISSAGYDLEIVSSGPLRAFRIRRPNSSDEWRIVVHPLWDTDDCAGLLKDFKNNYQLSESHVFVDSFNLSKRPYSILFGR